MVKSAISKLALAKSLGLSVSSSYYQLKRPEIDQEVRLQIESVMADHIRRRRLSIPTKGENTTAAILLIKSKT